MRILHTEASTGWGGQEIRILTEAKEMQGDHEIIFAVHEGAELGRRARDAGFVVYELPLKIKNCLWAVPQLISIIRKNRVDIVNTHSSADAWLGGIAARICRRSVIRTRHISAPIKTGLNSKLLYDLLSDFTVTTCEEVATRICKQANIDHTRCRSIPTGVIPERIAPSEEDIKAFAEQWHLPKDKTIIGTLCILRSWKGIEDLLGAASLLKDRKDLHWLIVGSGPGESLYRKKCNEMGLQSLVTFTGYIEKPAAAIANMDVFSLLSTANEGVSQASLQAAYLKKALITTTTGGLGEVTIDGVTGHRVPTSSPAHVAEAVKKLAGDKITREAYGQAAHDLVAEKFTFENTVRQMNEVYASLTKVPR
jgi:glycosyltransferase involved in cell wall biosynthesis